MSDILDDEIRMMETEGYVAERWQRGLAWLRELQQLRAAKAADRERVRMEVRIAISEYATYAEGSPMGGHGHVADNIASRVADALAVPVRPALTAQDRSDLEYIRDEHHMRIQQNFRNSPDVEADNKRVVALMERLLATAPGPTLTADERAELREILAEKWMDEYAAGRAAVERLLSATADPLRTGVAAILANDDMPSGEVRAELRRLYEGYPPVRTCTLGPAELDLVKAWREQLALFWPNPTKSAAVNARCNLLDRILAAHPRTP